MYTILLNETNELTTSVRERIMQRSKLVDSLHFLVDPIYKGYDMSGFTVLMEYLLPVSREYKTEILVKSDELYKNKLEYKLPIDTNLTREAGKVEVQLTFTKVELTPEGRAVQKVRKTSPTTITIVPIAAWSDVIADSALTAIDQRLIQVDAMLNAANDMQDYLNATKADNIVWNEKTNTIQLSANGVLIGDAIHYSGCDIKSLDVDEDGNVVLTLKDGRVIPLGHVTCTPGATFIPHIDEHNILTWTNDGGLANPPPVDLDPFDDWTEDGDTKGDYEWEEDI